MAWASATSAFAVLDPGLGGKFFLPGGLASVLFLVEQPLFDGSGIHELLDPCVLLLAILAVGGLGFQRGHAVLNLGLIWP